MAKWKRPGTIPMILIGIVSVGVGYLAAQYHIHLGISSRMLILGLCDIAYTIGVVKGFRSSKTEGKIFWVVLGILLVLFSGMEMTGHLEKMLEYFNI